MVGLDRSQYIKYKPDTNTVNGTQSVQYIPNHWHPHTTYQSHNHKDASALPTAVELGACMKVNRKKAQHMPVGDFKADPG